MALDEGHADLFEKVCDWCNLDCAKEVSELRAWKDVYHLLFITISYRCSDSTKLAARLANSKDYIKSFEIKMRVDIKSDDTKLANTLRNRIIDLNNTPVLIRTFRGLYPLILEVYNSNK